MTSNARSQSPSATRSRRSAGASGTADLERRLEAFLLIARRVGLS